MASPGHVMDHTAEIQQAAFEAKKAEIEREKVFGRLASLKCDIKDTLEHCHEALEHTSGLLVDYFRRIPDGELSEQIRQRFNMWDLDHSGALDRHELTEALAEMGKRPTEETMDEFMKSFDLDGNGTIELDEFEHMVRSNIAASTAHCTCHLCKKRREEEIAKEALEAVIAAEEPPVEVAPINVAVGRKGSVGNNPTPRRTQSHPAPVRTQSHPSSSKTKDTAHPTPNTSKASLGSGNVFK